MIEVIRQQQCVFEILWNKAAPAEKRIKEIEGRVQRVSTRILEDEDQIITELRRLNSSSTRLSICCEYGGMQMGYKHLFDSYLNIVGRHQKGEGEGMRWIININKENINLVYLQAGIQIRHVTNMPPMNFGCRCRNGSNDRKHGRRQGEPKFPNQPLYINNRFNSLFDEMWKNGNFQCQNKDKSDRTRS